MLFMVIESFKNGKVKEVGRRFRQRGRLLPEGVSYLASWMEATGARCFQVMDASQPELLEAWTRRWSDLIDFEIVPVAPSDEFWSKVEP